MINLLANTADQIVYLTLDEGRQYYDTVFTDYLLILTREENSNTGDTLAQVVTIVSESTRATKIELTTVGLTQVGRYRYEVYGQNSDSNTDPTDASVVGQVEMGLCIFTDNTVYFETIDLTIPDDITS
jgi:hypothetical protein